MVVLLTNSQISHWQLLTDCLGHVLLNISPLHTLLYINTGLSISPLHTLFYINTGLSITPLHGLLYITTSLNFTPLHGLLYITIGLSIAPLHGLLHNYWSQHHTFTCTFLHNYFFLFLFHPPIPLVVNTILHPATMVYMMSQCLCHCDITLRYHIQENVSVSKDPDEYSTSIKLVTTSVSFVSVFVCTQSNSTYDLNLMVSFGRKPIFCSHVTAHCN